MSKLSLISRRVLQLIKHWKIIIGLLTRMKTWKSNKKKDKSSWQGLGWRKDQGQIQRWAVLIVVKHKEARFLHLNHSLTHKQISNLTDKIREWNNSSSTQIVQCLCYRNLHREEHLQITEAVISRDQLQLDNKQRVEETTSSWTWIYKLAMKRVDRRCLNIKTNMLIWTLIILLIWLMKDHWSYQINLWKTSIGRICNLYKVKETLIKKDS